MPLTASILPGGGAHADEIDDHHAGNAPDVAQPARRQRRQADQRRADPPEPQQIVVSDAPIDLQAQHDHRVEGGKHVKIEMTQAGKYQGQSG
jgi:hypothetical protein